jgi:proteasome lid subunit RPN8/RPN11
MIRIEREAWDKMLAHATGAYPDECCGAMLGCREDGIEKVSLAIPLENISSGPKTRRYEIRPEDLLKTETIARARGLSSIGVYHSHPDEDAYFSETDLKHSCPWFAFVVLSIRGGRFDHARGYRPDLEQTRSESEPLLYPDGENALCLRS